MSGGNFGLWLILLVHVVWVLAPVLAYRKATGSFLGFAFKTGMILWLAAYAIGFALPFCYPLLVPYL